jgi:hypothetical protein
MISLFSKKKWYCNQPEDSGAKYMYDHYPRLNGIVCAHQRGSKTNVVHSGKRNKRVIAEQRNFNYDR